MKKSIILISIVIGLLLFSATAKADSPVTSTQFSSAYEDIAIVKSASSTGIMNSKIATYLADPNHPIDVKAAIINALSWDIEGKENAELYCKLVYKKSLSNLKLENLRGDQLFCIGYLMTMDDYNNTTKALKYLKLAEKKMSNSFTVSVIRALVESMDSTVDSWKKVNSLLDDEKRTIDMRQEAINIIFDYMALYDESNQLNISKNNLLIQNETSERVYLYGTYAILGDAPYQITKNSDIGAIAIKKDNYGIFYLEITGLINGTSSIEITNQEKKKVIVHFDVVSKETYEKLSNSIYLYIGSTKTYTNLSKKSLSKDEIPYMKSSKPYIPFNYSFQALGGKITYDKNKKVYILKYADKTITFTSGSKNIKIGDKDSKLNSAIEIKKGKLFISARDFSALTNKKYLFYNGLISIVPKNKKLNSFTEDFIFDEISLRIEEENNNKSTSYFYLNADNYFEYVDSKGNRLTDKLFSYVNEFKEGMAAVGVSDSEGNIKYGFINTKGTYIIDPIYDWAGSFYGGIAPVYLSGKAGFIDKKGSIKIPLQFKEVGLFSCGLAPVLNGEGIKYAYIDKLGNVRIPYRYTECNEFSEGLAAVKINDKWGYIDNTGTMIIEPIYDDAYDFQDGIASVTLGSEMYFINKSGKTICFYENGDSYIGEIKDGFLHGYGVYTWFDGTRYSGEFSQGEITGNGVYSTPNGNVLDGTVLDDTAE